MQARSEHPRGNLVLMVTAVVVAVVGIAALMILERDPRDDAQSDGISMNTTAVVERAGAMVFPTEPTARP